MSSVAFGLLLFVQAASLFQQDFLIGSDGSGYYAVGRRNDTHIFHATTADATINAAVGALGVHGGTIGLLPGRFELGAPILIDRSSVTLAGANAGGDLFFTPMNNHTQGFENKWASILVATGDFDAVQVGFAAAGEAQPLIFGVALHDIGALYPYLI